MALHGDRSPTGALMRILVDMNLAPKWCEILRDHRWEAVHWSTIGNPSAADSSADGVGSAAGTSPSMDLAESLGEPRFREDPVQTGRDASDGHPKHFIIASCGKRVWSKYRRPRGEYLKTSVLRNAVNPDVGHDAAAQS